MAWKYKKGQRIHLDEIHDIRYFIEELIEPYKPDFQSASSYIPEMSGYFIAKKNFEVKVIVKVN